METFDIIGALRTAANEIGFEFSAGNDFYKNIELHDAEMPAGKHVFTTMSFKITPTITNGLVTACRYESIIMLGRKMDSDGVQSSLDETYIQKYDRRLNELMSMLTAFIGEFACEQGLDIDSFSIDSEINKFDTNIDFVGGAITMSF